MLNYSILREQTTILIGVLLCGLAFLVVIMYIPSFKNETPMEKGKLKGVLLKPYKLHVT